MNHVSALRPPLPSLLTKAHSSRHLLSPEAHLPLCLPPHLMEGVFPAPSQDSCLNFCFPWIPPLTSHSARWAWIAPLIGPCLYSGGENGNPLQYSYVENPMDRGAWWATNHGVPNGQSQLSNWARIVSQSRHPCLCIMALPSTSCVTSGKSVNLLYLHED